MSTNYYLETDFCPTCGHPIQRIHIGKLSCGWVFCFQKYPDIDTLEGWFNKLNTGKIVTEYDELCTLDEFKTIIQQTRNNRHSENPLVERIDDYDWISGDFS